MNSHLKQNEIVLNLTNMSQIESTQNVLKMPASSILKYLGNKNHLINEDGLI